jgi:hypothetical protein
VGNGSWILCAAAAGMIAKQTRASLLKFGKAFFRTFSRA